MADVPGCVREVRVIEQVTEEWSLVTSGKPLLLGPGDLCADVTDDGMVRLTGFADAPGIALPLVALDALLKATAEWSARVEEMQRENTRH